VPLSGPAVDAVVDGVRRRAERVTHDQEQADQVRSALRHRLDSWQGHRRGVTTGRLGYEVGTDVTGLLQDPDEGTWDLWSAPRSLREVEAEIVLQLDRLDRSLADAPAWSYDRPPASSPVPGGTRASRRSAGTAGGLSPGGADHAGGAA